MVSVSFSSSHCNLLNFTFFMFPFVVKNKTKNFLPEHLNNHSDNTENKLLLSVFSFRIHSRAFKLWFHNNLSSLQKDNKHYDYLTRDTPETLTLYICMMCCTWTSWQRPWSDVALITPWVRHHIVFICVRWIKKKKKKKKKTKQFSTVVLHIRHNHITLQGTIFPLKHSRQRTSRDHNSLDKRCTRGNVASS